MAESQSMTTPEVVAKTLIAEHGDFLREAVAMVAAQIMEAEIAGEIGAGCIRTSPPRFVEIVLKRGTRCVFSG